MKNTSLIIHIIPSNIQVNKLEDFKPLRDGKSLSTIKSMSVNKTDYGFTIVYDTNTFRNINIPVLVNKIKELAGTKFDSIVLGIVYNFDTIDGYVFENDIYEKIMVLRKTIISNESNIFAYNETKSIIEMQDIVYNADQDDDYEDMISESSYLNMTQMHNDETLRELEKIIGPLNNMGIGSHYDIEDDEEDSDIEYREISNTPTSKVWKNTKNKKRNIKKYGIIIANKKDIKKDKKIINKFLKDFIPNTKSGKKYRKEVSTRFVDMYSITKKELKKRKKNFEKKKRLSFIANDDVKNLSNIIFKKYDKWSDPNR